MCFIFFLYPSTEVEKTKVCDLTAFICGNKVFHINWAMENTNEFVFLLCVVGLL